jgi:tellurite resistance protein TehA-like permease
VSATSPARGLAALSPAAFAQVMATGIVAIACHRHGLTALAGALLVVNLALYPLLWGLTIARAVRHPARVWADAIDHARAVGFFTVVAATCVLGAQLVVTEGRVAEARALWWAGLALWAVLIYGVLTLLVVARVKPPLAEALHGGWMVVVVAGQAVAVLGAQLAPAAGAAPVVVALALWLASGVLYLWLAGAVLHRALFHPVDPAALTPASWVVMGAAAISALAGASLVAAAPAGDAAGVLDAVRPFARGLTLAWWAVATWWIPLLVALGVWRHAVRRVPLRYEVGLWSLVFPLGMYSVATARVGEAVALDALAPVARGVAYVALGAWVATSAAQAWHLLRARAAYRSA